MELGPLAQQELPRAVAVVFISAVAYLLPSLVAWYRAHHNALAIGLLNLLLGWTVVGWIGALIWACTRPPER